MVGGKTLQANLKHENGFDQENVCAVEKKPTGPANKACCGSYPERFPMNAIASDRKCYANKSLHSMAKNTPLENFLHIMLIAGTAFCVVFTVLKKEAANLASSTLKWRPVAASKKNESLAQHGQQVRRQSQGWLASPDLGSVNRRHMKTEC